MSTTGRYDVAIIGGGIVGTAIAYELSRRGARVAVLDRGEPGFGCSYGNAGWLTPSRSEPLPRPGMLLQSLRWLLDPESPLYIKPRPSPFLARWLFGFVRSMNRAHQLRSVEAMTQLSLYSNEAYARLEQETEHATGFRQDGLLVVAQTEAGLGAAIHDMELAARHGIPGRTLSEAEVRAIEPAVAGPVRGGVLCPGDAHAEPLELVRAFVKGAKAAGADILAGWEVFGFRTSGRRLIALETTRGPVTAESFVLATGSWSRRLGAQLGLRIPVLGAKGYALIVPPIDPMPRRPLMLQERKIAVTPRNGSLRIAGTLELVDEDESITARRVAAIVKGARQYLALPDPLMVRDLWRGLRPCTPDGVPVIGFSPKHENLLIATGHQMLGLHSAPATGRLAADLLLGAPPIFDPRPYRPERF